MGVQATGGGDDVDNSQNINHVSSFFRTFNIRLLFQHLQVIETVFFQSPNEVQG